MTDNNEILVSTEMKMWESMTTEQQRSAQREAERWLEAFSRQRRAGAARVQQSSEDSPGELAHSPSSISRFAHFIKAHEEITASILRNDREETLKTFVQQLHHLLPAEACGIFLVPVVGDVELELDAAYSDKNEHDFSPVTLDFHVDNATGHVEAGLNHRCVYIDQVRHTADWQGPICDHLISHQTSDRFSLPLFDRKEQLLGLVTADNKKDAGGKPTGRFTKEDRLFAQMLANTLAIALDHLRSSEILSRVVTAIYNAKSKDEIFDSILQLSVSLVRADRGDLVMWDDSQKDLVIAYQCGDSVDAGKGTRVADPSVMRRVWADGGDKYLRTVSDTKDYHAADPRTKSELVVRFELADVLIGLLNVESFRENGFDTQDTELLRLLSQHASIAAIRARTDTEPSWIQKRLFDHRFEPTQILKRCLESIHAYFGCDRGLIYWVDYANRRIRCVESLGCDDPSMNPNDFSFSFEQPSLAGKVFHSGTPYFSADPPNDPNVGQDGIERFNIEGPIVGLPLVSENHVVGALVVWSRHGKCPTADLIHRLEPFAHMAAPTIAAKTDTRLHKMILKAAEDLLTIRQKSESDDSLLEHAVNSIHKSGLDRVRLYKYDPVDEAFSGYCSAGMTDPVEFKSVTIRTSESPYARDAVEAAVTCPKARRRDGQLFAADAALNLVEKPVDIPWVVVPLVVHKSLFGQIVVDNATTGRHIRDEELEYLNLFASVLAETLANVVSVESMRQRALPVLLRHLTNQDSTDALIRHFLVFLTSGAGLAFSRALFLEMDEERSRLVYGDGVGSITAHRFMTIARDVAQRDFDDVLFGAVDISDEDLHNAMADLSFDLDDQEYLCHVMDLSTRTDSTADPLAVELNKRIHGNHFLAAPAHINERCFGVFVVDRSWQEPRTITENDRASLEQFVTVGAFLLADHQRKRTFFESRHRDALIGKLIRPLWRSINSRRVGELRGSLISARGSLNEKDYQSVNERLCETEHGLAELTGTIEAFEQLLEPTTEPTEIHARTLVDEAVQLVRPTTESLGIQVVERVDESVRPARLYRHLMIYALVETMMNSIESMNCQEGYKRIDVVVRCVADNLAIEVIDNGPGIPDELNKIRFAKDAYTTDPEKGLGLGLLLLQDIVERTHGGSFHIKRRSQERGTQAVLCIPLNPPPYDDPRTHQVDSQAEHGPA